MTSTTSTSRCAHAGRYDRVDFARQFLGELRRAIQNPDGDPLEGAAPSTPGGWAGCLPRARRRRRGALHLRRSAVPAGSGVSKLSGKAGRAGIGLALIGVVLAGAATAYAAEQEVFETPKAAAKALVAAAKSGNESKLLAIFGPQSEELVSSGDPVADRTSRQRFVSDAEQRTRVETSGDTATLLFGDSNWPFPIPLMRAGDGWRFDTAAGKDELLSRRIGRNELHAIATCRAYVQAQREFARLTRDATGEPVYAQRLASEPGTHDGLYWLVKAGEPASPMGPLMAEAASAGYDPANGSPAPYHGYFFKILTAQGADAPGGARSYVVNGAMVGGFALLAYPATSGASGIMTFVVDRQGIVFEKNLGPQTDKLAPAITAYDPDASWDPVD